jgi:hypothetical protein
MKFAGYRKAAFKSISRNNIVKKENKKMSAENVSNEAEMLEIDKVATEMYDCACAARSRTGNPRDYGCVFGKLFGEPKEFYRTLAKWHLERKPLGKITNDTVQFEKSLNAENAKVFV